MAMNAPSPFANTDLANSPVIQHEQQRLQQGRQFLNDFVAGRINPAAFNASQIQDIISAFRPYAAQNPSSDVAQALNTFTSGFVGNNAPLDLQNSVLNYQASLAENTGQLTPELLAALGGNTGVGAAERGRLFANLAETFGSDPTNSQYGAFTGAFNNFANQLAPGGQLPYNINSIAALIPTYSYLAQVNPAFREGLAALQVPGNAGNLSTAMQNAITQAAKAALAGQGYNAVGPDNVSHFSPVQMLENILGAAGDVAQQGYNGLQNLFGANGYQGTTLNPTVTTNQALSAGGLGGATSPFTGGEQPFTNAQSAAQQATQQAKAALSGGGNANPATTSQSKQQSNLAQVQAFLQQNGISQDALRRAIVSNDYGPQFAKLLGNEGLARLQAWAQTALPTMGPIQPGTDPFKALFAAANGQ